MKQTNTPVESDAVYASNPKRIGEILINEGLITEAQLAQALKKQQEEGGKTFEILLRLGYLDKDRLHTVLAKHSGIATIDLSRLSLRHDLVNLIPHEMALEQLVLPVDRVGKILTVAMACPLDTMTIYEIESITGMRVKAMLSKLDDIVVAVENLYRDADKNEFSPEELGQAVARARSEGRVPVRGKLEQFEVVTPEFTANRLIEAFSDDRIPMTQISNMLEQDPVALCQLLDMANSLIFGVFAEVDTSPKALVLLGKQGVTSLFKRSLESKAPIKQEWKVLAANAYRSASVAATLVKKCRLPLNKYEVHTAACLCWLGRFALLELGYSKYKFINHDLVGEALCDAERKIADITHAEAGKHLLVRSNLNERLSNVVLNYPAPLEAPRQYQSTALLANIGAHAAVWKDTEDESGLEECRPYMDELGLKTEDVREALKAYVPQT